MEVSYEQNVENTFAVTEITFRSFVFRQRSIATCSFLDCFFFELASFIKETILRSSITILLMLNFGYTFINSNAENQPNRKER